MLSHCYHTLRSVSTFYINQAISVIKHSGLPVCTRERNKPERKMSRSLPNVDESKYEVNTVKSFISHIADNPVFVPYSENKVKVMPPSWFDEGSLKEPLRALQLLLVTNIIKNEC